LTTDVYKALGQTVLQVFSRFDLFIPVKICSELWYFLPVSDLPALIICVKNTVSGIGG